MNGTHTIRGWLQGTLVPLGALVAALALTSVGCVAQTGESESADEDNVGSAEQELDPAKKQGGVNGGGVVLPGGGSDAQAGDEKKDPQPQPWKLQRGGGDGDPSPDPDPYGPNMSSTPSDGHHDT